MSPNPSNRKWFLDSVHCLSLLGLDGLCQWARSWAFSFPHRGLSAEFSGAAPCIVRDSVVRLSVTIALSYLITLSPHLQPAAH